MLANDTSEPNVTEEQKNSRDHKKDSQQGSEELEQEALLTSTPSDLIVEIEKSKESEDTMKDVCLANEAGVQKEV